MDHGNTKTIPLANSLQPIASMSLRLCVKTLLVDRGLKP